MRRRGWIVCSDNGSSWMLINDSGSFFIATHVISLVIICGMTKVLFGTSAVKVNLIPNKKKKANEIDESKHEKELELAEVEPKGE